MECYYYNKMNFEQFIKNNSIINTMFNINENDIQIIDINNRIINKTYKLKRLYKYLPIIEPFLADITNIKIYIAEKYNNFNNTFIYKINFDIIDLEAFIFLTQDKNKININIDTNKKHDFIYNLAVEFYKNYLKDHLKPLISNLSRHSLALNII